MFSNFLPKIVPFMR